MDGARGKSQAEIGKNAAKTGGWGVCTPPLATIKGTCRERSPRPPLEIALRTEREGDLHFILSAWKWGMRSMFPELESKPYFQMITSRINSIRSHPEAQIIIACDPEDSNFIFGYSCFTGPVLNYVFVRQAFRRARVASRLVPSEAPLTVTAWTRAAEFYSKSHPGALIYEPSRVLKRSRRRREFASTPEVALVDRHAKNKTEATDA
jgi:hypothetical protein